MRSHRSITNQINQLSPLVALVSPLVAGPVSCQEVTGPDSSILVRETPADLHQGLTVRGQQEEEQELQEVKKDLLSPPSVASSLVCLKAQRRRRRSSLVEQKFKSM